jgi:hypothetical protein
MSAARLQTPGYLWAGARLPRGQGVAGEVAGVHVYGQELAYVEDPVR